MRYISTGMFQKTVKTSTDDCCLRINSQFEQPSHEPVKIRFFVSGADVTSPQHQPNFNFRLKCSKPLRAIVILFVHLSTTDVRVPILIYVPIGAVIIIIIRYKLIHIYPSDKTAVAAIVSVTYWWTLREK